MNKCVYYYLCVRVWMCVQVSRVPMAAGVTGRRKLPEAVAENGPQMTWEEQRVLLTAEPACDHPDIK